MAWVDLATVKQHLQISHTAEDASLTLLIEGVQAWLGEFTGLHLSATEGVVGEEFTEDLPGGSLSLRPRKLPIRSVSKVLDRENDDDDLVESEDLVITSHRILREATEDGIGWDAGPSRYRVTYKGGLGKNDTDSRVAAIKLFLLDVCYHKYHARGGKTKEGPIDFAQLVEGQGLMPSLRKLCIKITIG